MNGCKQARFPLAGEFTTVSTKIVVWLGDETVLEDYYACVDATSNGRHPRWEVIGKSERPASAANCNPMPDSVLPPLCDHCIAANEALGRETWPSFSTFSFNDGEFHSASTTARSAAAPSKASEACGPSNAHHF